MIVDIINSITLSDLYKKTKIKKNVHKKVSDL